LAAKRERARGKRIALSCGVGAVLFRSGNPPQLPAALVTTDHLGNDAVNPFFPAIDHESMRISHDS
jgi:hypothetical protein